MGNRSKGEIIIKGARVNNLKNIDVAIPRGSFTVITGLSGSGKSSLAFDTLYAEGQRRYVESLSSYARQFMGRMSKPECDFIRGIPPAIAIEQKVNTRNSRSTVGTSTEIYDYLRLLFARVGHTFSPVSGKEVKKHTSADVLATVESYPTGTRIAIVAPLVVPEGRSLKAHLDVLTQGGYSRMELHGDFVDFSQVDESQAEHYRLLIDRMAVSEEKDDTMRLLDSLQTAFYESHDECVLLVWDRAGEPPAEHTFSKRFEADGITFSEPTELMFNFNNPVGACPMCEGFGRVIGPDESLVIPDRTLSVYEDAVMCWRGQVMSMWKDRFIHVAAENHFPIHKPYSELTEAQRRLLWDGDGKQWKGINGFFDWLKSMSFNVQHRVIYARYRGKTLCPECHGTRLRKEANYVRVGGASMSELVDMPVSDLAKWFDNLNLNEHDTTVAKRLLTEIRSRLSFLIDVGLPYLTLNRLSSTLSGGESQRINLATSLGSSLVGSIYILDEPSIGLHPRDTNRLISVLKQLQRIGNTVVVVEHDEEIMRAADHIIDIGPEAGRHGGEVVYAGPIDEIGSATRSYTARYLTGQLHIPLPKRRRKWRNKIRVVGAAENNLKNITVDFPLDVMTVVTGVSGSGKSTLVCDILYPALARHLDIPADRPGSFKALEGDLQCIQHVELVDQNPIGKSSRSNPATYIKAFDEIRNIFANQQLARQMGYSPGFFSFNTPGGRCEACKGDGTITIEMQFMADITLPCEECHGKRFSRNTLEVLYHERNISDILDMTVDQAIEFFTHTGDKRVVSRLKPLADVGLGYIKLGQPSSTLSGGENQRVKLAYYLSTERDRPTMFIFDEPTTGLHFHDISTLLHSLNQLIERGHTVVIIEHNLDVIKSADHIIDLGPDGGSAGGRVVATGTPEQVAAAPDSATAPFLAEKFK